MRRSILLVFIIQFCVTLLFCQSSVSSESEAIFDQGMLLYNQENYEEAITKFGAAAELDGKRAETYFRIGLCYKRLKRVNESIRYFSKAIRLDSSYREAYGYRAYANTDAENYRCALADFNEVIKLDTVNICLYFTRGIVKSNLKNYRGAVEDYNYLLERKSELTTKEITAVYFNKAEVEYYWGKTDQAYRDFKAVVQRDPSNTEAFLYLGYIRIDQGFYEEAIAYLDACLEIDESNHEALYLRGWCKFYLDVEDWGEADLQRSVSLGNRDARAFLKENF